MFLRSGCGRGAVGLVVVVSGANFNAESKVLVNSTNRATTFIDTGHLSAVLLPDDVGVPGDEVVFIGESGGERILAEDVAGLLQTINYEIVCDVGSRVVRRYVGAEPAV